MLCFAPRVADKVAYFPPPAHIVAEQSILSLMASFIENLIGNVDVATRRLILATPLIFHLMGVCDWECSCRIRVDARGHHHRPSPPLTWYAQGVGRSC